MTKFRVWAPKAKKMEIQINKNKTAMRPEDGGWWELEVNEAVPGTDYAFIIDSSKPLPDPRSLYQPQGVHGPSRVVDHSVFKWNVHHWQPAPLASAVIYELHIGTFTRDGTFDAAIEKLDYLAELGITHVELMPVNEFPGSHGWGYDGVDLYAPHHAYGGPEALKRLVDACHAKNLAIILDVVYNHLGPSGNYLSQFGPYFTERYHTPWGEAVNLDGRGSVEVRKFFIDNALMWLRDYHFDCLRIDAVHAILDTSAIHFLEEMALEVGALEAQIGRKLTLIAESDLNDPRVIRPREIGGFGIDAQWNEDFHHALHAVLTREDKGYYADFGTLGDLADCLQNGFTYDGRFSVYRGRIHGKPAAGIFGRSFIGCIQNHDQVGNRARGDRISHITGHNRAKIAAALVLTSPFVPMLFQGEEWAASTPFQYFTDHQEEELGKAVSEGRRREFKAFGWDPGQIPDPQDPKTFRTSKLNWNEIAEPEHSEMLDWYKKLIRLRREQTGLTDDRPGGIRTSFNENDQWFVVERGPIVIICNLAGEEQIIKIKSRSDTGQVLLASHPDVMMTPEGMKLPSDSVAIIGPPNGGAIKA